ncbi:hypothetical protein O7595_33340 [Streptomyces sp. WMMC940]|nr:hypothetical protein [Streptomyces sp. WMMC940]MCZ7462393.1 hypothetical protein [Streptomyces sp. WMMC940]
MSEQSRLLRQHQTPLTLVQMRQDDLEPQRKLIQNVGGEAHTRATILSYESNALILYGFTSCATCSA